MFDFQGIGVNPPNLLNPSDFIITKVFPILSHFEWKFIGSPPSIVAWYNFFIFFIFLFIFFSIVENIIRISSAFIIITDSFWINGGNGGGGGGGGINLEFPSITLMFEALGIDGGGDGVGVSWGGGGGMESEFPTFTWIFEELGTDKGGLVCLVRVWGWGSETTCFSGCGEGVFFIFFISWISFSILSFNSFISFCFSFILFISLFCFSNFLLIYLFHFLL